MTEKALNNQTSILNRGVEQLVARWAHNPKVVGSSPAPATTRSRSSLIINELRLFYLPSVQIPYDFVEVR